MQSYWSQDDPQAPFRNLPEVWREMSDHFKFDINVVINNRVELEYSQKERGDEIKEECKNAVKKVLEERFCFREYREDFWVSI
jgi:hypothetical protein